jgi:hypothetical protein
VWRDDECKTVVKGNGGGGCSSDDGGCSFDGVVIWLGRRQNRDVVE